MAFLSYNQLQAISDAEIIQMYDERTRDVEVGIVFLRDELVRRAADRSAAAMEKLTRWSMALAAVSAVAAIAAVVLSVITLVD